MVVAVAPSLSGPCLFCKSPDPRTVFFSPPAFDGRDQLGKIVSSPSFIFLSRISSWRSYAVARRQSRQISAAFRSPTRRRNSLRKKVVDPMGPKVRDNPRISLPDAESPGKLENWVEQYEKDSEFWGVGSGSIFMVHQNSDGNVVRVFVNEDEIVKRNATREGNLVASDSRISYARSLAKEIQPGGFVLPKNSSIAKFVIDEKKQSLIEWSRFQSPQGPALKLFPRVGLLLLCGCFVLWGAKKLISRYVRVKPTRVEAEMLQRKKKLRMQREENKNSSGVDLLQEVHSSVQESYTRPLLDRDELMKNVSMAKKKPSDSSIISDAFSNSNSWGSEFDHKVREIREMARKSREIEEAHHSQVEEEDKEMVIKHLTASNYQIKDGSDYYVLSCPNSLEDAERIGKFSKDKENAEADERFKENEINSEDFSHHRSNISSGMAVSDDDIKLVDNGNTRILQDKETAIGLPFAQHRGPAITRPKIIRSVKEAREYLAQKKTVIPINAVQSNHEKDNSSDQRIDGVGFSKVKNSRDVEIGLCASEEHFVSVAKSQMCNRTSGKSKEADVKQDCATEVKMLDNQVSSNSDIVHPSKSSVSSSNKFFSCSPILKEEPTRNSPINDGVSKVTFPMDDNRSGENASEGKKNWIEENFEELDPVLRKIGDGFRGNYVIAREKSNEINLRPEISDLVLRQPDDELEWMNDDKLRGIVFRVRENELAGRDPFHLMGDDDKRLFFEGLEQKADNLNEKLLGLHEWIHSRIENLDYGTEGISLYDPPEKIIPRWKGPVVDKDPDFINQNNNSQMNIPKSDGALSGKLSRSPKVLIECSDGSSRAGKQGGNEQWQHTKKWSQGFLEVYNNETDPEVKSVMKDMGKDLNRWITDKEREEVENLITKIPKKQRRYIEKKMDKLKREVERFGPHAVISKYREYADEKEEDYLWWLDLPFVLCIELYTIECEKVKVGLYSLEMAADLELNPKQFHTICFEDPGDSKNFCYIIQSHMDMLGMGKSFVVARHPKDAFREAKANGFNITVIKKGEIKLNVDQALEEVEDEIIQIGSKMYQDKIMRERGVDIRTLTKGVISANKSGKLKTNKRLGKQAQN